MAPALLNASATSSRASSSSSTTSTLTPESRPQCARAERCRLAPGRDGLTASRRRACGQTHHERCASPGPALAGFHRSAVRGGDLAHQRQAQARDRRDGAWSSCRLGEMARTRAATHLAAMPSPLSLTWICTSEPTRVANITIEPALGVNFSALVSRFHKICCSRSASALIVRSASSSALSTVSAMPLASAAGRSASAAARTASPTLTAPATRTSLPLLIRDRSSTSSIRRACARALRSITVSARCTSGAELAFAQHDGPAQDHVQRACAARAKPSPRNDLWSGLPAQRVRA